MQKFTKCAVALAVLGSFSVCAMAAASGTYTSEAQGRNGPVKVEVTFDNGKIASVKLVSHKESTGIADPALERIPAAIIAEQSVPLTSWAAQLLLPRPSVLLLPTASRARVLMLPSS